MITVIKKFTPAKKFYKTSLAIFVCVCLCGLFVFAKNEYTKSDFGETFGRKAANARKVLYSLSDDFGLCSKLCNKSSRFMQALVFPEVMRFSSLKDDIETESLRTLYVQLGEEYANFSIGLFQMKPSFAQQVEQKAILLLGDSINHELQLCITAANASAEREERINRLQDKDWQLIYLTAFICICDKIYSYKDFMNEADQLQWYATVYNAGFNKTDAYISKKVVQENFYLNQGMPDKKFKYAAIAGWFYSQLTLTDSPIVNW